MAEITLKYAEGYEVRCPLCGMPESQSPVRYPDAQKPGERWITCSKCGMSYKSLVWQAAGGGVKGNARTVDAVEVVRCKDCKHEFGGSCIICGFQKRKPEDFCSYGERKETE